ncbi:MAG: GatB/YqeY domain-containing protein [Acidiferrobacterales bacterium]
MSLKDNITVDMKSALKARDKLRLGSIRLLLAAIQRKEVDERITLDDTQTITVAEKLIKQSRDALSQFQDAGRTELADKELADIAVWEKYLPEQLSGDEIDTLVTAALKETGAASIRDMGKVMGILKPKLQGRADMGQVGAKIKAALSG